MERYIKKSPLGYYHLYGGVKRRRYRHYEDARNELVHQRSMDRLRNSLLATGLDEPQIGGQERLEDALDRIDVIMAELNAEEEID